MEKKTIVEFDMGPEGKGTVEFVDGKLQLVLAYAGADVGAKLEVNLPAKPMLEAIKAKIPGKLDDYVIDAGEAALGL